MEPSCCAEKLSNLFAKPMAFPAVQETHELSCCVGNIWTLWNLHTSRKPWNFLAVQDVHGTFWQCNLLDVRLEHLIANAKVTAILALIPCVIRHSGF
jgi:hypothetical protein